MWKKCNLSEQATFIHCFIAKSWPSCVPFLSPTAVDRALHGQPDRSVATRPRPQQTAVVCIVTPFYPTQYEVLHYCSSSVWLNHAAQPLRSMSNSEPWLPMALVLVLFFPLRPLVIAATDKVRPGTPHNSYVGQQNIHTMSHVSQVQRGRDNQNHSPQRSVIILLCLIGVFHTPKMDSRGQQEMVAL